MGQEASATGPGVQINLGPGTESFSLPIRIIIVLTVLAFLPAMLISMTSFTRIIIVVHFLRQALGTQSAPNNQILIGLTLFLTFFVMGPVWDQVYDVAIVPYQGGSLSEFDAMTKAIEPLRSFMVKQVREDDLALFVKAGKLPQPKSIEELPLRVIVPAFMISELKTAFQIGFVLFLPFLVIDMVVSSILLSMGMLQLPPIIISTPFKILLFILVDGWNLVVGSLLRSF
jgi:flagellar biosynthetic protein FliP